MNRRTRKTKIVCTRRPASSSAERIRALMTVGTTNLLKIIELD